MNTIFINVLTPIAAVVGTGLATIIGYYVKLGCDTLKSKETSRLNAEDKKIADELIDSASNNINLAVVQTNQTFTDDLKAASETGKLTSTDAANVLNHSITVAKTLIGTKAYADLAIIKPDLEAWVLAKVLYYVNLHKSTPLTTISTGTEITSNTNPGVTINLTGNASDIATAVDQLASSSVTKTTS